MTRRSLLSFLALTPLALLKPWRNSATRQAADVLPAKTLGTTPAGVISIPSLDGTVLPPVDPLSLPVQKLRELAIPIHQDDAYELFKKSLKPGITFSTSIMSGSEPGSFLVEENFFVAEGILYRQTTDVPAKTRRIV